MTCIVMGPHPLIHTKGETTTNHTNLVEVTGVLELLAGTEAGLHHVPTHLIIIMDEAGGIGLAVIVTTTHPHLQVKKGKSWPASADEECINQVTGEHYLMLEFTKMVNDDHNCMIFAKVASLVWQDLQNMANSDCLLNRKETYHGFKEDWQAQNNAEKKAAKGVNQQSNRHAQRHKEKADWLMTARQGYIKKFGVDPVDLVHADHMLDEASGQMMMMSWRMIGSEGWQRKWECLPTRRLKTDHSWRSLELGQIFHTLHDLWQASLTSKQKKRFHMIRVTGTDRQSQRIPDFTPYTFGINMEWLEANKDRLEYQDLLKEWGAWEDPEGFGYKKREHQDDQGTPNDEVDQDNTRGREG
ncbi:hypothetical protein BDR07DRAFT_1483826 [Suillus spraguei]|nr:hypothetical protein BDR07DRAFT_1483826 [Suillus spraguei]